MLNGAGLTGDLRNKTWAEYVMTATYLSNVIATRKRVHLSYFTILNPSCMKNLKYLAKLGWLLPRIKSKQS
jgi:hypothetical protein